MIRTLAVASGTSKVARAWLFARRRNSDQLSA